MQEWIHTNKSNVSLLCNTITINPFSPLTNQVEALEHQQNRTIKKVRFRLDMNHRDRDSRIWRATQCTNIGRRRRRHENASQKRKRRIQGLTKEQIKKGVLDGTIPSAISDTGATSTAGKRGDPFDIDNALPPKVFKLPNGTLEAAESTGQLQLPLREPANRVDVVPNIEHTLLSGVKMAEAGYTAVYDKDEVNFYDKTAKIQISEEAVLKGYRCPVSGLWRVALREQIEDEKVDTLILDSPCGTQSLNTLYEVPRTDKIRVWLKMIRE